MGRRKKKKSLKAEVWNIFFDPDGLPLELHE